MLVWILDYRIARMLAVQTVIDNLCLLRSNERMKSQQLLLPLIALTLVLVLQSAGTATAQDKKQYFARLTSPQPGQVVSPGQVVRIAWIANFPGVDLSYCETEVLLSLDGGKTIYGRLTESRNPAVQYFDWTVPNTPTSQAVLDIRFGCLNLYPETPSLQLKSTFAIGPAVK